MMVRIHNVGSSKLNLDFIGTFFDFETAVDGKHSDEKSDNFNNKNIGHFWIQEDGSETTITTSSTTDVVSLCEASCPSNTVYTGTRRLADTEFKCMCFDQRFTGMVARSKHYNALYHYDCDNTTPGDLTTFDGEPLLLEYFSSTIDLLTTTYRDNDTDQRPNLCNPKRVVNLATLYLSSSLGLELSSWVSTFYYDPSKPYVFPNTGQTGPSTTYPPVEEAEFPNLEQVYWTILSQYSEATEPGLRSGRSNMFCRVRGIGVYQHCTKERPDKIYTYNQKSSESSESHQNNSA